MEIEIEKVGAQYQSFSRDGFSHEAPRKLVKVKTFIALKVPREGREEEMEACFTAFSLLGSNEEKIDP